MEKKKLTFEEIANILKDNVSLEFFATGYEYDDETDEEFDYPEHIKNHPAIVELGKLSDELHKKWVNHPTHEKSWREREADAEYQAIQNEFYNRPNSNELMFSLYMEDLGLGKVVEVDQYGGSDQGSSWYVVKHFVDHDVYIRVNGYYSSYEGTDFFLTENEPFGFEVEPVEKVVVFYEPKKK